MSHVIELFLQYSQIIDLLKKAKKGYCFELSP